MRAGESSLNVLMVSLLLQQRDLLFMHVPKTAGGSIGRALRHEADAVVKPVTAMQAATPCIQQMRAQLDRPLEHYKVVTFVRNPWDWTVSGYLHVTQNVPAYETPPSFEAFVKGDWQGAHIRQYPPKFVTAEAYVAYLTQITQWDHLCADGTPMDVYSIGRFENLQADLRRLLGFEITLPHANKSDREPYQTYYNDATRAIVRKKNTRLIEHFGYEF